MRNEKEDKIRREMGKGNFDENFMEIVIYALREGTKFFIRTIFNKRLEMTNRKSILEDEIKGIEKEILQSYDKLQNQNNSINEVILKKIKYLQNTSDEKKEEVYEIKEEIRKFDKVMLRVFIIVFGTAGATFIYKTYISKKNKTYSDEYIEEDETIGLILEEDEVIELIAFDEI